jgi:3-dehydroquinate dehydratase-2
MRPVYVLNGPNLNRLGTREPQIYGTATLREIEALCRAAAGSRPIVFRQTNAEHQLVDWIQEAIDEADGLILNPAGLSFHSVPVLDALRMFPGPIIELHLSNLRRRDPAHRDSILSAAATAVVMGLGADGYPTAVGALLRMLDAGGRSKPPGA